MELVYTHLNLVLVENAKNLLDNAGMETQLKNQFLVSGFGEICGIDSWPELWIADDSRREEAQAILLAAGIGTSSEVVAVAEWRCAQCREMNADTFGSCWQCQADRPQK